MAAALLAIKYFRMGNDLVAGGLSGFCGVLLSAPAAGFARAVRIAAPHYREFSRPLARVASKGQGGLFGDRAYQSDLVDLAAQP